MKLTDEDQRIICELLKDYQWHIDHYNDYVGAFAFGAVMSAEEADVLFGRHREVKQRIQSTAPFVEAVFSGELPKGFTLLQTLGEQWYAWCPDTKLSIYGPTSEFQVRLWCWRCLYIENGVAANGLERDKAGL